MPLAYLGEKKTGFKLDLLYVFSVEILHSKSETFMKKKNMEVILLRIKAKI